MSVFSEIPAGSVVLDTVEESPISTLLDKNAATTAAVGLAVATGGVSLAVTSAVLPVQTALAVGAAGTLFYVGDRQAKNLPMNPFDKSAASDPADAVGTTGKQDEPAAQAS